MLSQHGGVGNDCRKGLKDHYVPTEVTCVLVGLSLVLCQHK